MGAVPLLHLAAGALLALAAWLMPRYVARARRAAAGRPAARSGAARARRGIARFGHRKAALRRGGYAGARRRLHARRLHDAADVARAGRVLGNVRAAAGLHPSASLFAVCRTGPGARRRGGGDRGGACAAGRRAGAVHRAARCRRHRRGADCRGRLAFCARAAARRRGPGAAPPRTKRRAVRRCRGARAVRHAARPHDHCPGRAKVAAAGAGGAARAERAR